MSEKETFPQRPYGQALVGARPVFVWGFAILLLAALVGCITVLIETFGLPARHNAVQTDAVQTMNVAAWHEAGYQGEGIAIAIVSTGFARYRRQVFRELPAPWEIHEQTYGVDVDRTEDDALRGTALAEVVYDIAPQAHFIFIDTTTNFWHVMRAIRELPQERPTLLLIPQSVARDFSADEMARLNERILREHSTELLPVVESANGDMEWISALSTALFASQSSAIDARGTPAHHVTSPASAPTRTLGTESLDDVASRYPLFGHDVAAAHVAAAAALVWQAHPELSADALKEKLLDYARLSQGSPGIPHPALRLPDPPT